MEEVSILPYKNFLIRERELAFVSINRMAY